MRGFRIGDAAPARSTHAALYDALRLVKDIWHTQAEVPTKPLGTLGFAMVRNEALQVFIDAMFVTFDRFVQDDRARNSTARIADLLESAGSQRKSAGSRLPVCSHLTQAFAVETESEELHNLIDRFRNLEPLLEWRRRPAHNGTESKNFADGHANAMILGPGGVEERNDLWLGVSLMAPHVRYPDHTHPPEETYLVMSKGEFRQADNAWFSPGIGGTFYNPPGIKHAMRSANEPLLAFWALPMDSK